MLIIYSLPDDTAEEIQPVFIRNVGTAPQFLRNRRREERIRAEIHADSGSVPDQGRLPETGIYFARPPQIQIQYPGHAVSRVSLHGKDTFPGRIGCCDTCYPELVTARIQHEIAHGRAEGRREFVKFLLMKRDRLFKKNCMRMDIHTQKLRIRIDKTDPERRVPEFLTHCADIEKNMTYLFENLFRRKDLVFIQQNASSLRSVIDFIYKCSDFVHTYFSMKRQ